MNQFKESDFDMSRGEKPGQWTNELERNNVTGERLILRREMAEGWEVVRQVRKDTVWHDKEIVAGFRSIMRDHR